MDDDFEKKIAEQYENLPEDVKSALRTTDIRGILANISRKNDLRVDQAGALENETLFVMLGLEHPDDFVKNLQDNLPLPPDKAAALARDVDAQLLQSVRASLMRIQEVQKNEYPAPEVIHEQTHEFSQPVARTPARPNEFGRSGGLPGDIAKIKLEKVVHEGRYTGTDPYREAVE